MDIVQPFAHIYMPGEYGNAIQHIEHCARICYKSEDKIGEGTGEKFVKMLVKRGHLAAIEHYRFVLLMPFSEWNALYTHYLDSRNPKYRSAIQTVIVSGMNNTFCIVSCNARNLIEMYEGCPANSIPSSVLERCMGAIGHVYPEVLGTLFPEATLEYWFTDSNDIAAISDAMLPDYVTNDELLIHGWFTAQFITDRGIANEVTRHRSASFCQESTRYCNYSLGKYNNNIKFIPPSGLTPVQNGSWLNATFYAENEYFDMTKEGATPQVARGVLPLNTKTELFMTATYDEWVHFIELRASNAAHPDIRPLAKKVLEEASYRKDKTKHLFDELYLKYCPVGE